MKIDKKCREIFQNGKFPARKWKTQCGKMPGNIPKWNISLQNFFWMSGKVAVSKKWEKEKRKKKKGKTISHTATTNNNWNLDLLEQCSQSKSLCQSEEIYFRPLNFLSQSKLRDRIVLDSDWVEFFEVVMSFMIGKLWLARIFWLHDWHHYNKNFQSVTSDILCVTSEFFLSHQTNQ